MKAYHISDHARWRMSERGPQGVDLREEIKNAVPFGAQYGKCFMLLMPCGMVAAGDGNAITTVLSQDQAIVNMQSRGMRMAPVVSVNAVNGNGEAARVVPRMIPVALPENAGPVERERAALCKELQRAENSLAAIRERFPKSAKKHGADLAKHKMAIQEKLAALKPRLAEERRTAFQKAPVLDDDGFHFSTGELVNEDGTLNQVQAVREVLRWLKAINRSVLSFKENGEK